MAKRRRVLPPVYFLVALLVMVGLNVAVPVLIIIPAPYTYGGIPLIAAGIGLVAAGARLFARAGTTIKPFEDSSALVTDGLYRFSRNPMYVGLVTALLGAAVLLGSLTPFLVIPVFIVIIRMRFISAEEAALVAKFGPRYEAYRRRVRRWL
jgi:protein-S-isoprenylcysteine O-methyltransferase Ste14